MGRNTFDHGAGQGGLSCAHFTGEQYKPAFAVEPVF